MTPKIEYGLRKLRDSFNGKVYVVRDSGEEVVVCVVPDSHRYGDDFAPSIGNGDWSEVTAPTLMLMLDSKLKDVPPVQELRLVEDSRD